MRTVMMEYGLYHKQAIHPSYLQTGLGPQPPLPTNQPAGAIWPARERDKLRESRREEQTREIITHYPNFLAVEFNTVTRPASPPTSENKIGAGNRAGQYTSLLLLSH